MATDGVTVLRTLYTNFCYDLAGDLRRVTPPNANAAGVDCNAAPPAGTLQLAYDAAHRRTTVTDADNNAQSVVYDADGQVAAATDANNDQTTVAYNQRNQPVQVVQPFDTGRTLTS